MAEETSAAEARIIAHLLGGKRVLKQEIGRDDDLLVAVRNGLPYPALVAFQRMLQIQMKTLSTLVGITARTLARRKQAKQLNALESDRLYRVAYIVGLAQIVLGSLEKAKTWLNRNNRALGGVTPMDLLDTEIGVRQVEAVLTRLNHGIYS